MVRQPLGMRPQIMHKSRQGLMELNIFFWMKSLWWNKYDIFRRLCSDASCIWITSLQWYCGHPADVTYDCPRSRSCHWKGTLASSDYCCDTEKKYETKDTNSKR